MLIITVGTWIIPLVLTVLLFTAVLLLTMKFRVRMTYGPFGGTVSAFAILFFYLVAFFWSFVFWIAWWIATYYFKLGV